MRLGRGIARGGDLDQRASCPQVRGPLEHGHLPALAGQAIAARQPGATRDDSHARSLLLGRSSNCPYIQHCCQDPTWPRRAGRLPTSDITRGMLTRPAAAIFRGGCACRGSPSHAEEWTIGGSGVTGEGHRLAGRRAPRSRSEMPRRLSPARSASSSCDSPAARRERCSRGPNCADHSPGLMSVPFAATQHTDLSELCHAQCVRIAFRLRLGRDDGRGAAWSHPPSKRSLQMHA
jgi:hypothetical protein